MVKTKDLREILNSQKLTFLFPGELADNYYTPKYSKKQKPLNLKVTVYPASERNPTHKVFINGVEQRLLYMTESQNLWFKKEPNTWFKELMEDWRCLLSLDQEEMQRPNNKLYEYLLDKKSIIATTLKKKKPKKSFVLGNFYWDKDTKKYTFIPREKKKQIPKPLKKVRKHKHEYSNNNDCLDYTMTYVKDLNNGFIEEMPQYKASRLIVAYSHYDYCSVKEWYIQEQNKRLPKTEYWIKTIQRDEDGNPIKDEGKSGFYTPKKPVVPKIKFKYLVKNRKLVGEENNQTKKRKSALYDKDKKRQLIVIQPALKEIVYKTDNPKYNKEFVFRKKKKTICVSEGKSVLIKKKRKYSGVRDSLIVMEKPLYKTEIQVIKKNNKRYNKFAKAKIIDYIKSKKEVEEFVVPVYYPVYDYVPIVLEGKTRESRGLKVIPIIDKEGNPVVKKVFKKLEKESATIKEPTRITYKTIIVSQYSAELSRKRGIIKRNYELLKEQEEKRKKEADEKNANNSSVK